eukprot:c16689_g1_i1 orf=264-539(-)
MAKDGNGGPIKPLIGQKLFMAKDGNGGPIKPLIGQKLFMAKMVMAVPTYKNPLYTTETSSLSEHEGKTFKMHTSLSELRGCIFTMRTVDCL